MLKTLTRIRGDERRNTLGAFMTLFGLMTGHSLLETARDALFLANLPPSRLPFVYLAIAAVALTISGVWHRTRTHRQGRAQLSVWLLVSAGVTFGFWMLTRLQGTWVFYALYVWTGVFATLIVVRFWTLLGDYFTVTQAKRLFALIGTGSVAGAIAGSALAQVLASRLPTQHLLGAAAASLLAASVVPFILTRHTGGEHTRATAGQEPDNAGSKAIDLTEPIRVAWSSPYTKRLAILVMVSTITLTVVDYLFKSAMADTVPASQLGYVFATTYLILNVFSLLAQVLLVGVLTRTLGVSRVLALLPLLLLGGAIWLLFTGSLFAILLNKLFDGTFRHSLHRTATEILYVPLSAEFRARAKNFIDVVGQRGGQAIASLAILLAVAVGSTQILLGIAVLLLTIVWIGAAVSLKDHYLDLFRTTLSEGSVETRIAFPSLDMASLESLIGALSSQNDSEVVAALDMLADKGRTKLIPALILYHPSPRVVTHALEVFSRGGRDDHLPIVSRLLSHSHADVRAEALRSASAGLIEASVLREALDDPSPRVSVTARVCLALACEAGGTVPWSPDSGPTVGGAAGAGDHEKDPRPADPELYASVVAIAESGSVEEKHALAHAIRHRPSPVFEDVLLELLDTTDQTLRVEAVRAMRAVGGRRFMPHLLKMLAHRETRLDVRAALVGFGSEALEFLDEALRDESLSAAVRRHLPRTISRFDPEEAARLLLEHMPVETDGVVRYRILRALGRLRTDNPSIALDTNALRKTTTATLEAIFRLVDWRQHLQRGTEDDPARATPVHDLLITLLRHKERNGQERLFRLLGLLYPNEDFRHIYRGLLNQDRNARASSRELIENLMSQPLRGAVLAASGDVDDEERLRHGRSYYKSIRADYEGVLRTMIDGGSLALRSLVVYHAGELRLHGLKDNIMALRPDAGGMLASTVERSIARLSGQPDRVSYE